MPKSYGTCFSAEKLSPEQQKKHASMMSAEELNYLQRWAQRRPVAELSVSKHLQQKDSVSYNPDSVKRMLEDGNLSSLIIEYNRKVFDDGRLSRRILIRDNQPEVITFTKPNGTQFEAEGDLCIVVDLDSWKLVTVYWNLTRDNHDQVNWSRYERNLVIMED